MTALLSTAASEHESAVLFVLVDSAAQGGRLHGESKDRWVEARARIVVSNNYEAEAPLLFEILQALEAEGALRGTWLENRWRTIKRRVEAASHDMS